MLSSRHLSAQPEADEPAQLAPWVVTLAEFVHTHTRPTVAPYVPEIPLRLGTDSVVLWDQIERGRALTGFLPYWAFAWAGGLALARHILDDPALVAGRRVLDLAAGSGVTGIAAAKRGAAAVTASDIDPLAVIAISLNAEANGVAVAATASDMLADDSGFDPASVDVVLAGDAFYEPSLAQRATAFLARCRAAGCDVLIGDPGRTGLPVARLSALSRHAVPVSRECQYVTAGGVADELHAATVWRLAR